MLRSALLATSALALSTLAAFSACATAPAMRSPLKERLASADTPSVEDAARACLTDEGWIADPIGSVSGGSNVVSAHTKEHDQVQVFVNQPDQLPRVTGGPDDPKFWRCLSGKLNGGGGADDSGGDGGAAPKDKDDKNKDPGDKGGGAS
jgi:hypothetical protein